MARSLLVALLSVLLIWSQSVVEAECLGPLSTAEYGSLWEFYNSTDGPNWNGWLSSLPNNTIWHFPANLSAPCVDEWQGLQCDVLQVNNGTQNYNCTISQIFLPFFNVHGTVPSVLGLFSSLYRLDLRSNTLHGSIPCELGALTVLRYLSLEGNRLTGSIPTELGNAVLLWKLSLYGNQLTGSMPSELGKIVLLRELNLYDNQLTGSIPSELGKIVLLRELGLYDNQLTGSIPSELGNIQDLRLLILTRNSLNGSIPSSLGKLSALQFLELCVNRLTGSIPKELGNLSSLRYFYLYLNKLIGTIPSELGNLQQMVFLDFYENRFTGQIPSELALFPRVEYLDLAYNYLTGTIPYTVSLPKIEYIDLSANNFCNQVPPILSNLSTLISIDLGDNDLTGIIPLKGENLKSLRYLGVYSNKFTGPLPTELGNVESLQFLDIHSNCLTGTIATELASLPQLKALLLSENSFTGTIPPPLFSRLEYIGVNENFISGSIPNVTNSILKSLVLSFNYFTGYIPDLINCSKIESFLISDNYFFGTLSNFSGLPRLVGVDLSENLFSGSIGNRFVDCLQLQSISLGSNSLSGPLPNFFHDLPNLMAVNLSENALSGRLDAFSSHQRLRSLDVSSNHFTGMIPSDLFLSSRLTSMLLYSNCFSGTLPSSICLSTSLEYLILNSLSSNCKTERVQFFSGVVNSLMSGGIPDCMWTMNNLNTVLLSGNKLTGSIIADATINVSQIELKELILTSNELTGTIPLWLQHSRTLTVLDVSKNRISGLLQPSLTISPTATLLDVSVNRLSGNIPSALFGTKDNFTLNMLEGNLFSCSAQGGLLSWGSGWSGANLPVDDLNYANYICGSSGFDKSLLLFVLYSILCISGVSLWMYFQRSTLRVKFWIEESLKFDVHLSLMVRTRLWNIWKVMIPVLIGLLIGFVSLKNSSDSSLFSTHSKQYLWETTAAFLHNWVSALIVSLSLVFGMYSVIWTSTNEPRLGGSQTSSVDSTQKSYKSFVTDYRYAMGLLAIHVFNISTIVITNALYVGVTVSRLPRLQLFAVQVALSCFKLIWNDAMIPFVLRQFTILDNRTSHRVLMSLFTFIGGPFISTFFSSSSCFLGLFGAASLRTTVTVPQYTTNVICETPDCRIDHHCLMGCYSTSHFEQTKMYISSVAPWVYSFQCSSVLLQDYVPIMIAAMSISAVTVPFSMILLTFFTQGKMSVWSNKIINQIAMRSYATDDRNVKQMFVDGHHIRVKMLINLTVTLTFALASPLLGILVLLDSLSWCLTWHVLIGRQLELLRSSFADSVVSSGTELSRNLESTSEVADAFSMFSNLSLQAKQKALQTPMDHLMVLTFVGVFWSLFLFDMIGDVYGNLQGGLCMLVPLLTGVVVWLMRYRGQSYLGSRDIRSQSNASPVEMELTSVKQNPVLNSMDSTDDCWSQSNDEMHQTEQEQSLASEPAEKTEFDCPA